MPRKLNPGTLKTGHGKTGPDKVATRPSLTGAGLVGPGPNVGVIETPIPHVPGQLAMESVATHLDDPKQAHKASAIEHDGHPDLLWSSNVEGALDELIGTVVKRPPMLGEWDPSTTFSGIPDWGYLKLRDASMENYAGSGLVYTDASVQNAGNVFPYLLRTIGPPRDAEFVWPMADPRTDWTFNTGIEVLASLEGAGEGRTHIGGYTRDGDTGPAPLPIFRSARIYPRPTGNDAETGRPARVPVTLSGTVFPADRGVLALFHFVVPRGGDVKTSFLAQPLVSDETAALSAQGRVVAAILLGNGILGDPCYSGEACDDGHQCDGDPGGIFDTGTDSDGNHDPFLFPGRATGQYGLKEIHEGVDSDSNALKAPYDDLDGDTVAGTSRTSADTVPAPGQVRLGTDPEADATLLTAYGIPILGGTSNFYDVAPVAQNGSLAQPIHGDALVFEPNFFRYRLPVLKDYSPATGLKWTPRGEVSTASFESRRFFDPPTTYNNLTYEDGSAVGASFRTAGLYDGFDEDYWVWQVARYRQTFLMPSIALDGNRDEVGTYMLVHFKREADFESFARDGIFPWDAPVPYEVYGVSPVDAPEDTDNLANPWLPATAPVAPDGPAPDYGYAANPWHVVRNRVFMDPAGKNLPAMGSTAFDWATDSVPGDEHIVWVSGVAYFVPRDPANGNQSFTIQQLDATVTPGFWTSFRTDSLDLTGVGGIGPADVASQNPAFLVTAPWGYGDDGGAPALGSSLVVPVNTDPALGIIPSTDYQLQWRLELPFTHLGSNGGGVFTDANSPLDADTADVSLPGEIVLVGDDLLPSFSRDAVMRAHFRRPIAHVDTTLVSQPWALDDGHGALLTHVQAGKVLMHTTRWDAVNKDGIFGNFHLGGGPPHTMDAALHPASKDYSETFLDEVARYVETYPGALAAHGHYNANALVALTGPGMGGWALGLIETPTRIALANAPWDEVSFLLTDEHLTDQTAGSGLDFLQVAGLPDRNPSVGAVNTVPYPSAGVLIYPQTDFSTGHFPVQATHMADPQPDYSAAVGVRKYTRVLDAAFVNHATPVPQTGATEVTLRLDGITLDDIAYRAPGPGGLTDSRVAVLVKVPGLTTWLDAGRADGGGPSKQDPNLDGAGCQVAGTGTYTFTDPVTGYKGCYVKVHVGPVATLFSNPAALSGYTVGSPLGESPLMVQVRMDVGAVDYALEKRYVVGGVFEVASKTGGDSDLVRGLFGITLVHPNDSLVDPD